MKEYANGAFQVTVAIFIDMDIEDQALVFSIINLKQTKVSKSLAYNLYQYATSRSPQKTCHDIAKLLNSKQGSPCEDRIKILGKATPGKFEETLTQATFVDRLLPLISDDPDTDRDMLKRRKGLKRADRNAEQRLVFRNMFIEERDAEIARVLWNYFSAVQRKWPVAWSAARRGLILNRTTGFVALMRLLPVMYTNLGWPGEIVREEAFYSLFAKVTLQDWDFTPGTYLPGSTGQGQLYRELLEQTGLG